jgi:TP901 family phage tail tape measure protein
MTVAAELQVLIGADTHNLVRGLRDAEGLVDGFASKVSSKISSIGTSFIKAGAGISQLTAPLAGFGQQGIEVAANFESAMAEISARTGTVGEDLEKVRQFALQMGADTSFSAQNAADAFLQLLSSGQSTTEAMATLPAVLAAAAASGEDLGATADYLTDIMAAFQLEVGDAAMVSDVLAQAAGASSADIASLAQGFNNVGSVASNFGMSVEDVAAALALLAENGIKGAEAGTALRSMLTHITSGTEEVEGTLNQLGVSLTDAAGSFRPLNDIIEDLNKAMNSTRTVTTRVNNLTADQRTQMDAAQKAYAAAARDLMLYQSGLKGTTLSADAMGRKLTDLSNIQANAQDIITQLSGSQEDAEYVTSTLTRTQEENFMAIKALAGAYGQTALTALLANDGFDDMIALMNGQATASEVAEARMNTFAGRMESLGGSVETLMITALTPFLENTLKPIAEKAIDVVNQVTAWANVNPSLTASLVAIAGASVIAGPLLVGVGTAMTLAAPAATALAGGLGLLLSPLGIAAAGALLLFGALGGIDGIKEKLEGFTTFVSETLIPALETGDFSKIGATLKTKIEEAANNINDFSFTDLRDKIAGRLYTIAYGGDIDSAVSQLAASIAGKLRTIQLSDETLGEFTNRVKTTIRDGINRAVSELSVDFEPLRTKVQTALDTALIQVGVPVLELKRNIDTSIEGLDFSNVQGTFEGHFDTIVGLITAAAGIVFGGPIGLAIGAGKLIASAIENDFLGIGTLLQASGITGAVETAFNDLKGTIDGLLQSVFGVGEAQGSPLDPMMASLTGSMQGSEAATGPLALFAEDLKRGLAALQQIIGNIGANIAPGLKDLGDGIKGFIANLSGTETEGLLRVVTVITGAIGGIAAKVLEIGSDVLGSALSTLGSVLPSFGSAINNFISSISNIGEGDWGGALTNLGDGVLNLVEAGGKLVGLDIELPDFTTAIEGFRTMLDAIPVIIDTLKSNVEKGLNDFAVSIRGGLRDVEQTILDAGAKLAAAGQAVGVDTGAADIGAQLAGSLEAENLEKKVQDYLAGNPVDIKAEDIKWQLSGAPTAFTDQFVDSIVDPVAIQAALSLALEQGDEGTFNALVPLATELGIDTADLQTQYQASLTEAANAQIYNAVVTANVKVLPGSVDVTALNSAIVAAAGAFGAPASTGGAKPVTGGRSIPAFAEGGKMARTGLALIHGGERILNPAQTRDYEGGGRQPIVVQLSAYGTSPREILEMVQRAAREMA